MEIAFASFMILMAIGIISVWVKEIVSAQKMVNYFGWKEGENLLWPHITVEIITGVLLLIAGIGTFMEVNWAGMLGFFSMGALFYTSFNSLGWILAKKDRRSFAIPMILGLVGSVVFLIIILLELA